MPLVLLLASGIDFAAAASFDVADGYISPDCGDRSTPIPGP
jgi:hypothetical protein